MGWFFWSPLAAASLHMVEEFVSPGHFPQWYKHYKPGITKSITTGFLAIINGLLLFLCYDVGTLGRSRLGVALWLCVMALLAANGFWHLRGTVRTRSYSPGVLTGSLVYLPLAVYGYVLFLRSGQASVLTAVAAFAIGASYQCWSNLFHGFRARGHAPVNRGDS
ncbi:MAG: HXXEE domain-containing protein [Acidobacteria bacterium]|nr:HXXEE domain-containing protein [Acidobacteriota bacterium]